MVEEIRIYYESLEQAENYILPLIKKALVELKRKTKLTLIKIKKGYSNYSKSVAPLIYWKDPDILITLVKDGNEYPLTMIEFSSAVFTEDHELQRFDGIVVSAKNNCIYAKISPHGKKSQSGEHGGNTHFDPVGPYSAILKKFGKTFYHFDWKCDKKGDLTVDENYLSCPRNLKEFELFINRLIKFSVESELSNIKWTENFDKTLLDISYFGEWSKKLQSYNPTDINKLNTSRTTWLPQSKELVLKLNRFGHAMDPERGMLAYYGTICDNVVAKMSFCKTNAAWYKSSNGEKKISEYIQKNGLSKAYDYFYSFVYGSGLYQIKEIMELLKKYENNKDNYLELDISHILKDNYAELNKPMRTIFKYSTHMLIADDSNNIKVRIKWDKVNVKEDYSQYPSVTSIKPRSDLDEDDVTYITVHSILKPNGYKILATSYPGAQGDRVVLVAPGTGRSQQRTYVDIISYLPKKHTSLQENKGEYSRTEVQNEINKMSDFKNKKENIAALSAFMKRYDSQAPKKVKVGIGFWANRSFTISKFKDLDLKSLDYFVYVSPDMKEWSIWSTGKGNLFRKTKGKVNLPEIYQIG